MKPKSKTTEQPTMPLRFPNDPEPVQVLINESERVNQMAQAWQDAKAPNPIAAEYAYRCGWAYALAASHLRCFYKGELRKQRK